MKSKLLKKTLVIAMSAAMLTTSAMSLTAFAADTEPVQTASVANVTFTENHSIVHCINYYIQNGSYHFQIKYPKDMINSVIIKIVSADGAGYMTQMLLENTKKYYGFELNYLYSDENYEYQELVINIPRDSYQYTWNGAGIKIYYYDGNNAYMATNTSSGNTTEGNGYYLAKP